MKNIKDMYRPEVVLYVHSNQGILYSVESSLKDIKQLHDERLYEVAYRIEEQLSLENRLKELKIKVEEVIEQTNE